MDTPQSPSLHGPIFRGSSVEERLSRIETNTEHILKTLDTWDARCTTRHEKLDAHIDQLKAEAIRTKTIFTAISGGIGLFAAAIGATLASLWKGLLT